MLPLSLPLSSVLTVTGGIKILNKMLGIIVSLQYCVMLPSVNVILILSVVNLNLGIAKLILTNVQSTIFIALILIDLLLVYFHLSIPVTLTLRLSSHIQILELPLTTHYGFISIYTM